MLDSFIIERIRRERERERESGYQPLRIERPPPPPPQATPEVPKEKEERGSVVIDFRL
jgi:hypothetical protein